jgi:Gas vesicle synthesis protein GvpO
MATEAKSTKGTSRGGTKRTARSNGHVGPARIVRRAVDQVGELTGRSVEGVLGLERDDDGWVVTLEVVELRRVPDSTDVLGSYAVAVDSRGELQGYRRTRRYYRSQVEED